MLFKANFDRHQITYAYADPEGGRGLKIFEHVQNFRDYFAPLGDTCEKITNHWRLLCDPLAMSVASCRSPVR